MKEFVHHKVQFIESLIDLYNNVQHLYISRAYEFDERFMELLHNCMEFYKSSGTNTQVSEVLNIASMFDTAKKGIHPFELKKVSTGRRELKLMIAHHGLEKLFHQLKIFHEKETHKLEEAEEILSNLILSLYQSGVLDNHKINELNSIEKIDAFWKELLNMNGTISAIDKKLRLKLIPEDIYLIIDKLLTKIK